MIGAGKTKLSAYINYFFYFYFCIMQIVYNNKIGLFARTNKRRLQPV